MLLLMTIRSTAGLPEQSAQPRETHDLRRVRTSPVSGWYVCSYRPACPSPNRYRGKRLGMAGILVTAPH
jgi:hypothetical protein